MRNSTALTFLLLASMASPALAYIGPGAGISVVGSLLGLLGTVLLAVGVIFLWPFRRLLKKGNQDVEEEAENIALAEEKIADNQGPEQARDQ